MVNLFLIAVVQNFGCTLDWSQEILKVQMPCLHSRPGKSGSLGLGPRIQYFLKLPVDFKLPYWKTLSEYNCLIHCRYIRHEWEASGNQVAWHFIGMDFQRGKTWSWPATDWLARKSCWSLISYPEVCGRRQSKYPRRSPWTILSILLGLSPSLLWTMYSKRHIYECLTCW